MKSADIKSRKNFSFEISTPERTYLLYADNDKEKDDWIGAVGKSIVRSSKTYLNDDGAVNHGASGSGNGRGSGSGGKKKKERRKMTHDDYGYGYDDDYDSDEEDDDSEYGGDGGGFENQNNHPYFND